MVNPAPIIKQISRTSTMNAKWEGANWENADISGLIVAYLFVSTYWLN